MARRKRQHGGKCDKLQASHWLHFLDKHDHERFLEMDLSEKDNFSQLIEVFHKGAQAKGILILCDFNYIDFVPVWMARSSPAMTAGADGSFSPRLGITL